MNALDQAISAVNARVNQLLVVAQACLPAPQFQAFRRITLDLFGRSGFQKDLEQLLREQPERNGTGRPTCAKKGGA